MPTSAEKNKSRGAALVAKWQNGRRLVMRAALPGARDLPVVYGVNAQNLFRRPLENVLAEARKVLVESGRVYRWGNQTVLEVEGEENKRIEPLSVAYRTEPHAASLLANLFIFAEMPPTDKSTPQQFPPTSKFVRVLLNSEQTSKALPTIQVYSTRPTFDTNFEFRDPGWHPGPRILVHGPEVEPVRWTPASTDLPAIERLPPRLRHLLQGFCFRQPADLVNCLGALLTGLLAGIFTRMGKPVLLLDGNQPRLGKTLLARVIGVILDGSDPTVNRYSSSDEELSKQMCATLRNPRQSILIIDNAKVKSGDEINSPTLEANSTAPQISLRILGRSANFVRPNDVLWAITMNGTKGTADLIGRALPIRFHHDGNPNQRDFGGQDPINYAMTHRVEILGELVGMVIHWVQAGRPDGHARHSLTYWVRTIGGILEACGFPQLLQNQEEAAAEFSSESDVIAALAEAAIATNSPIIRAMGVASSTEVDLDFEDRPERHRGVPTKRSAGELGLSAGDLEPLFRGAGVWVEQLDSAKGNQGRSTTIGRLLAPSIDRKVPIEVDGRAGSATLQVVPCRSRAKRYYFHIEWDSARDAAAAVTHDVEGVSSSPPTTESQAPGSRGSEPGAGGTAQTGNDEIWS